MPRMLVVVTEQEATPLGVPQGRIAVQSRRTSLDKPPWRDLPLHEGVVESVFVRPAYLGESIAPFRVLAADQAVIPYDGTRFLNRMDERIDRYPGLARWWKGAEAIWNANRSSDKRTLADQLDYIGQLRAQFPIAPLRVVYTKAGTHLAAAVIEDAFGVIDHSLYWAPASTVDEAHYLVALLNTPTLGHLIRPFQAVGAFGPRHFDKYVWQAPIPMFDPTDPAHRDLSQLAIRSTQIARGVHIPSGEGFQAARRRIRQALASSRMDTLLTAALKEVLVHDGADH